MSTTFGAYAIHGLMNRPKDSFGHRCVCAVDSNPWCQVSKRDRRACTLADRHYSRRKVGSSQFMPPGQTLVLLTADGGAVWGWWRPHPDSGIRAMNGLDGWTCTIFRREYGDRASDLILGAERTLVGSGLGCGPDGLLTYVWDRKVSSTNPGFCFKQAGWSAIGRSADGRKTLLWKSWECAGLLRW